MSSFIQESKGLSSKFIAQPDPLTPPPPFTMKICSCEVNSETESAEHALRLVPDLYGDIQTSAMAIAM